MKGRASFCAVMRQLRGWRTIIGAARVKGQLMALASWIAFLVSAGTLSMPVWRPVTNGVLFPGGEAAHIPIRSNQNEFFRLRLP